MGVLNAPAPGGVAEVAVDDGGRLAAGAVALAGQAHWSDPDALAETAAVLTGALPVPVVQALHRFAAAGSDTNVLLLRGLTPPAGLQPSPGTATPPRLDRAAHAAALVLLAVMTRLGQPFTFTSLYEGRLVQHITPAPGQEQAQTSEGSDTLLDWHVEDAFTADRCDAFGLYCLRGDPHARTLFAPIRAIPLDPRSAAVLREPRFRISADVAHGTDPVAGPPVPVLTGPADDPEVCFDAVYLQPADPGDQAAAAALRHLGEQLATAARSHVLIPGDLLILDNRRVMHARTAFPPRYDGTGRWLLRVMVTACGRAHRRRAGRRVIA